MPRLKEFTARGYGREEFMISTYVGVNGCVWLRYLPQKEKVGA